MDVRIAFIKKVELYGGEEIKAGDIRIFNVIEAEKHINNGNAVYYSDFSESMLKASEEDSEEGKLKRGKKGRSGSESESA